ncbi:MAG TPA: CAP domain-containing protein [Chroococcidiopsis sp.]
MPTCRPLQRQILSPHSLPRFLAMAIASFLLSFAPAIATPTHPQTPSLEIPTAAALEQAVYDQINQHRVSMGLAPLTLDPRISDRARAHSQAMAEQRIPVSHYNFRDRARQIRRIVRFRRIAENVAYIFTHRNTADRAVQGWLQSASHRASIEGNYSITGIGVVQGDRGAFYFTQIFVRPRR